LHSVPYQNLHNFLHPLLSLHPIKPPHPSFSTAVQYLLFTWCFLPTFRLVSVSYSLIFTPSLSRFRLRPSATTDIDISVQQRRVQHTSQQHLQWERPLVFGHITGWWCRGD
jgi:hypothetical protein